MKTPGQLMKEFIVHPGTGEIINPGKFQGERLITPYLHDLMLNGESLQIAEDQLTGQTFTIFQLSDTERKVFHLEPSDQFAAMWETDTGFCRSTTMSQKEAEDFLNQFNEEE